MIKYTLTAATLKFFSLSPQTKRLYRFLGNTAGQKARIRLGLEQNYVDRVRRILELCEKHHAVQDGDKLLEIGTGWVHWESTIIRLFYDVEITLFDVWDNRNLKAYKHYCRQLEEIIDEELDLQLPRRQRVHELLQAIANAESFDEIYHLLGFRYVINPKGTLEQFQDESFSVIFSCNVFEHVDRSILPQFIQDFYRLLIPGGHSLHKIDPGDHLAYYTQSVSRKNYLRYSDKVWRWFFENDVQYFNRVQRPEWVALFQKAGFELVEEESILGDIGALSLNQRYCHLDRAEAACVTLTLVHRKTDQ
jgi:cyclopropane fatty-acyl-phospholipid synthase-like methyltransferase